MKTSKNQDIKYIYVCLAIIIVLLLLCIILLLIYLYNDSASHVCNCNVSYYINNNNSTRPFFSNVSKTLPTIKYSGSMCCVEQSGNNKYDNSVILNEIKNLQLKEAMNSKNSKRIIDLEAQIAKNKKSYSILLEDIDNIIQEMDLKNVRSH